MLFVMIGYPLPHILIVQSLQESIRVPHIYYNPDLYVVVLHTKRVQGEPNAQMIFKLELGVPPNASHRPSICL